MKKMTVMMEEYVQYAWIYGVTPEIIACHHCLVDISLVIAASCVGCK
jgi:hypothetical protein